MKEIRQIWTILTCLAMVLIGCGSDSDSRPAQPPGTEIITGRFVTITTELTGAGEVPPVSSPGTGIATMTVDLDTGGISGAVSFAGFISNTVGAHIHQAAAGLNGPIIIPLEGGTGVTTGAFTIPAGATLSPGQIDALVANELYFNIHTLSFPDGEIRGQIIFPAVSIFTPLAGGAEVPPVITPGSGTANLIVNLGTGQISGEVAFSDLTSTSVGAHIHQGAAGVNGPVIASLEGGAGSTAGTWSIPAGASLTPEQIEALLAGGLYFNIHSANFPDGEIRGQIINPVIRLIVQMKGGEEVPPVTTTAAGIADMTVNADTGEIKGFARFGGLSSNSISAHIHEGAAGVNGPIILPFIGGQTGTSGVWHLPPDSIMALDQRAALFEDLLYVNIHSELNPGGELRGQIKDLPAR